MPAKKSLKPLAMSLGSFRMSWFCLKKFGKSSLFLVCEPITSRIKVQVCRTFSFLISNCLEVCLDIYLSRGLHESLPRGLFPGGLLILLLGDG